MRALGQVGDIYALHKEGNAVNLSIENFEVLWRVSRGDRWKLFPTWIFSRMKWMSDNASVIGFRYPVLAFELNEDICRLNTQRTK